MERGSPFTDQFRQSDGAGPGNGQICCSQGQGHIVEIRHHMDVPRMEHLVPQGFCMFFIAGGPGGMEDLDPRIPRQLLFHRHHSLVDGPGSPAAPKGQ